MLNDELSVLAGLKIKDNNAKIYFEICDPETGKSLILYKEDLSSLYKIKDFLNDIKSKIKKSDNQTHYQHWIKRGWRKSLDYYVASRVDSCIVESKSEGNNRIDCEPIIRNTKNQVYSIRQALAERRTKRFYKDEPLERDVFFSGMNKLFPNIKNNLKGFKIYCIIYNVTGLKPGIYLLDTENDSFYIACEGNFSREMSNNLQGMRSPETSAFTIILVADFDHLQQLMPYPKGLRDVFIETGRLAQKIIISYMQLGVYALPTPALSDKSVSQLLGLQEPNYYPLYSLTFGYSAN